MRAGARRKADDRRHRAAHKEADGRPSTRRSPTALSRGWNAQPRPTTFFCWNRASTAMHFRTHVAEKNLGKSGQDPYSDRMVVHDEQIGMMLNKLDELGIADTPSSCSNDNGPENEPGGRRQYPFRGQKDSNWEGGWRVPCFIRWPGTIKPGSVFNGIVSHIDMSRRCWLPPAIPTSPNSFSTVARWAARVQRPSRRVQPDSVLLRRGERKPSKRHCVLQRRRRRHRCAGRRLEVQSGTAAREIRWSNWAEPFVKLRLPHIMSLRRDPFERADFNRTLLRLDGRSRAPDVRDAGGGGWTDRDFIKFPPRQTAGVLQPGRGNGANKNAPQLK